MFTRMKFQYTSAIFVNTVVLNFISQQLLLSGDEISTYEIKATKILNLTRHIL